ncbi:MAG: protein-L-isoaspartate(D-aspartate) O-methyltransferase [Candidatus Micrarchaeota archaeon]|nr:protein-L-isoaspartate(D-aspartate) O-methyltransferase [Candidatus Micrarchaeota archaeon]
MDKNKIMIDYLLKNNFIDERIAKAMEEIKREYFIEGPLKESSYIDLPLPIGFGQTISAPSIVGIMMKELDVKEGINVLEIGTGSGWQTALLGKLVGENGKVFSIERIKELAEKARQRISEIKIKNIVIKTGDGTQGWPENAPYDRIIVSASAPEIPKPLLEQLKNGGKMIIPIGVSYWQDLILVEKDGTGKIRMKNLLPVMFVPLVGKFGYPEMEKN